MKRLAATLASLSLIASASAEAQQPNVAGRRLTPDEVRMVAPALEKYTQDRLYGEVWKRPGLTRDRSIVTVAALIARELTLPMPYYFNQALDNGVTPSELSEIITISRSIRAGRTPLRRSGPPRRSLPSVASDLISSRRHRLDLLLLTKPRKPTVLHGSGSSSAPPLRGSFNTPPTSCFATCGCARTLRHATGVS